MKMRDTLIVPLSRQAVDRFKDIQAFTGRGGVAKYIFPSEAFRCRP